MNPARIAVFAPLIKTVCQELPHGYPRERILFELAESIWRVDPTWDPARDAAWCPHPPFLRVARLTSGYSAGLANELPKRVPWWIADLGKEAAQEWLDEYAKGARDRDIGYDDDCALPEYLPIPGPNESSDDRAQEF